MIKRKSSRAIVIIALVCALLVSSALFISGCGGNNSDNSYTIVYDSQGGAAVKTALIPRAAATNFICPLPASEATRKCTVIRSRVGSTTRNALKKRPLK